MKKNFFLSVKVIFLLFCALLPTSLTAQFVEPKFDELTVGIPNCVLQDKNGFIWIGAQEGLLRYDGYSFKKYQNIPFDSTSLSANWVTTLAEDKYGNLWVGTISGLNYLDKLKEKFLQFKLVDKTDSTLSAALISKIIIDANGLIWIGTFDHGLFYTKFDKTGKPEFTHYNLVDNNYSRDSQEKFWIIELYEDNSNCLWIGTKFNGLKSIDLNTGTVTHFRYDPNNSSSLSHNTVRSICADRLGNVWIGTGEESVKDGGGLNMYNTKTGKFIHFRHNPDNPGSLPSDRIFPIFIDSKGLFWMGFDQRGIISIPISDLLNSKQPDFSKLKSYPIDYIQYIYEDRSNNIWFAQIGWTLYKYDLRQNPFSWYHREKDKINTMSSTGVQCIYIDHSQNIWFGHISPGLDKYNAKTGIYTNYLTHSNYPRQLAVTIVTGICEDNKGFLWLASLNSGLYRMDPRKETFQRIHSDPKNSDGPLSESLWYMLMSKTDKLWIASIDQGLFLFDPTSNSSRNIDFERYGVENDRVSAMFEDQDGTLWLGSFGNGLYEIQIVNDEIQTIKHYVHNQSEQNSLSYNSISDIIRPTILDSNALWIATTNGLNRFDLESKTFTHFFKEDGIPDNLVLKILEDNEGNIWSVHLRELCKYIVKTGEWRNYGIKDGMPFETFGGSRQNTAKSKDGQLFFSGGSGTIGFYPDQIKDNPIIPPVYFTDFKIFNESVKLDTSIVFKKVINLSYDQNAFSFEFAALNYTNPGKNQYAYKMGGFHDDWIYSGNENTASFTNLDPGEYIFRVKGSNNHSIWNEGGTSIRIIIMPPWWATIWAYLVYASLFVCILFFGLQFEIRRRQHKIETQIQKEKELRKLKEAEHRAFVAELQSKAAESEKEREKEQMRSRIASDLHDEIGSNLSSIDLMGQVLHKKLSGTDQDKNKLKDISHIARMTAESMREIIWFVNPRNDSMEKLIVKMRDTANLMLNSIEFTFKAPGDRFLKETDINFRRNFYLIFKESLQNIIKHSKAKKVRIQILADQNCIRLCIKDNGIGFNTSVDSRGQGLKNIKQRAKEMDSVVEIKSDRNMGTEIILTKKYRDHGMA